MDILIHYADGSVTEHDGLAEHIDFDSHVEMLGFELFPEAKIPSGDYGRGQKVCCRQYDEEYDSGEYDVAQIIVAEDLE